MKNVIVLTILVIISLSIIYSLFFYKYQINTNLFPKSFVVVAYDGGKIKEKCEISESSSAYKKLYSFVDQNKNGWLLDYQIKMPKVSFMSSSLNIELREERIQINYLEAKGSRGKTHVYRELDTSDLIFEVCGVKL